jgi:SpoVK/Ycf46/Vps4 family AAA+-type ATPase
MTQEQAEQRNADAFNEKLRVLDAAACGVILCRTREPHRAIEAVRNYAFSREGMGFSNWTPLYGWETYDRADPLKDPDTDGEQNPVPALHKIGGIGSGQGMPNGFYTVFFPHFWLKDNVGARVPIIYTLKEYVRLFSETKRRLVLIAPVGYTLPTEIAEDVVVLDFDTPSFAELRASLDFLLDTLANNPNIGDDSKRRVVAKGISNISDEDKRRIVAAGMGMSQQEFETAVSRALVTYRRQLPALPIDGIVDEVMSVKTEVVKRSEVLEVMPTTGMDQVGGLDNLKEWVVKRRACFSTEAKEFGIEAPKGAGLFGPPGTGKSLSAKAIASSLGLPLIKFDVGRVFQSLVGQSEERVRASLKMLDSLAPCVVLLDEIDKAFQTNSGGDSGVSQRVLGAILTHMQESSSPIFWVFSANRVDRLPPELLRRGRLDEIFAVTVPDEDERLEILKIHLNKRKQKADDIPELDAAVAASEGYVPAEIEQAVKDALIEAFTNGGAITGPLIAEQLANMKPLSEAFAEDFNAMQQWAENNARPASARIKRALPLVRDRASRPSSAGGGRAVQIGA